jgi:hypothetical protein
MVVACYLMPGGRFHGYATSLDDARRMDRHRDPGIGLHGDGVWQWQYKRRQFRLRL